MKDEDWAASNSMAIAVKAKFQQNRTRMDYLKSTAPKMLVHANAHDQVWANGLAITDKNTLNPVNYKGNNELGKLLMDIRNA